MYNPTTVAKDAFTITKSDTTELPDTLVGIYVGGTGDVNILTHRGVQVLFKAVPVGTFLPIKVRRVMATSTTATNMLGLLSQ